MTTPAVGETAPAAAPAADPTINPAQAGTPATPVQADPNAAPAADPAPVDPPAVDGAAADPAPEGGDAEVTQTVDEATGVVTYSPTGDAGMDMALAFAGKLGLGMDHPAMAATATGDWSLLEAHLATLGDDAKGWEQMMALAKEADGRLTEKRTAAAKATNDAVAGVLGDNQQAVLEWASTTATPDEKREINAMLRSGPVQARAAAMMLANLYQQAGGTVNSPASATTDAASAAPNQQSLGPLTNRMFAEESAKLHAKYGNAYIQTPEFAALSRRLGQ